ncbi:hypothetical protein J6590_005786 [Homalodisca vitripennis]|nr:hypothetical protein J6590_005786 [Homalodisca vitripennis]
MAGAGGRERGLVKRCLAPILDLDGMVLIKSDVYKAHPSVSSSLLPINQTRHPSRSLPAHFIQFLSSRHAAWPFLIILRFRVLSLVPTPQYRHTLSQQTVHVCSLDGGGGTSRLEIINQAYLLKERVYELVINLTVYQSRRNRVIDPPAAIFRAMFLYLLHQSRGCHKPMRSIEAFAQIRPTRGYGRACKRLDHVVVFTRDQECLICREHGHMPPSSLLAPPPNPSASSTRLKALHQFN